jgi:hypothetical protein
MPLVRGDPLELNLELRKVLYQTSHAHENVAIIQSHSYPWGGALGAVILMLFAPFALAYLLENRPRILRVAPVKKKNALEELYLLKGSLSDDPRALSFKVGELFKEGFEPILQKDTASMTFQELLSNLRGQKVNEADIKRLSHDLENMQFQKTPPTKEEVSGTLDEVTSILIKNTQN